MVGIRSGEESVVTPGVSLVIGKISEKPGKEDCTFSGGEECV